jgi:nitrogen fixation protein FixH
LPTRRHISALALAALVVAGGCKSQKQPAGGQQPAKNSAILATQAGSAFRMSLAVEPAQPKFASKTRFRVHITDDRGAPLSGADVKVSLVMPLMDMGKNEFLLEDAGNGNYEGAGEFGMTGEWEVIVTANAGKTGKYTFNVNVVE